MKMTHVVTWMAAAALVVGLAGPEALAAAQENANRESKGKPTWVEAKKAEQVEAAPGGENDEGAPAEETTEVTKPGKGNEGKGQVKEKGNDKADKKAPMGDDLAPAGENDANTGESGDAVVKDDGQSAPGEKARKEKRIKELKDRSLQSARQERQNGVTGPYLIYVNGKRLNLTPLAHNGRTLVPFRNLSEYLGATVEWEPSTRTVTMTRGETTVQLTIGSTTALVNGEEVTLEVPAEVQDGLTFVPVRFVADALGAFIEYDPETGAITLITLNDETGDDETGDDETGDDETGDDQTGDDETGDDETGDDQTGDDETGDDQTGDDETGDDETGDDQTGDDQTGDDQTGDDQTGDDETGDDETGDDQSGDDQTGDDQTGDDQTGDDQTGDDHGDDQTGDDQTAGN